MTKIPVADVFADLNKLARIFKKEGIRYSELCKEYKPKGRPDGVSRQYISKVMNGNRPMPYELFVLITTKYVDAERFVIKG